MITADQLKDVMERAEALRRYLDIDRKKIEFEEEDLRTQAPDFWEDPKRAEEQMKKVKGIKRWIDGYNEVRLAADELQLAFDFYKDEMVTEEEVDTDYRRALEAIESLELKNMLRQKEDPMDCVMKINSGAGGDRKSGLGPDAHAYVSALGRGQRTQGDHKQPAGWRRGRHQECDHADRGR